MLRDALTFLVTAIVTTSVVASCSSTKPPPPAPTGLTYYTDVKPVVDAKCAGCHQPGGLGPFPLLTADDLVAHKDAIKDQVSARTMPPWPYSRNCADYVDEPSLTDDEIATIVGWVDGGGVAGDPARTGAPLDMGPTMSRVDAHLSMPAPYTPTADPDHPDDYRCFIIDWPYTTDKYVTGFLIKPGQIGAVHHVVPYLVTAEQADYYAELQAADTSGRPGYTCFGGPGGATFTSLGGWAPGGSTDHGTLYPDQSGIRVAPGSKVILQVHYNFHGQTPGPDATSIDLQLEDNATPGEFLMTTDPAWVFHGMDIPAGNPAVRHSASLDVSQGRPFTLYNLGAHMHLFGKSAKVAIDHAGGDRECLIDTTWRFHSQRGYVLKDPRVVNPGDKIYLECNWDNSRSNQPVVNGTQQGPVDVNWGEGTGDEMCVTGMYIVRH